MNYNCMSVPNNESEQWFTNITKKETSRQYVLSVYIECILSKNIEPKTDEFSSFNNSQKGQKYEVY